MEVAETAEATAQAAHALTQLSVLLPSQGLLFGKAACHAAHQDASVRAAGQQSGAWSEAAAASPSQAPVIRSTIPSVSPHSLIQSCTHSSSPSFLHLSICFFLPSSIIPQFILAFTLSVRQSLVQSFIQPCILSCTLTRPLIRSLTEALPA